MVAEKMKWKDERNIWIMAGILRLVFLGGMAVWV